MQNREELREKDTKSKKNDALQEEEKHHFRKGGGINIVFRPKYRPPALLRTIANNSNPITRHPRENTSKV
jgi:hypothetical protein